MKKLLIIVIGGWLLIEILFLATLASVTIFAPWQTARQVGYFYGEKTFNPIINEFISLIKKRESDPNWVEYDVIPECYLIKHFKLGESKQSIEQKLVGIRSYEDYSESTKRNYIGAYIEYNIRFLSHNELFLLFYFDDDNNLIEVKGFDWNKGL